MKRPGLLGWPLALAIIVALYPLFPQLDEHFFRIAGRSLGGQMANLFIFVILALALNVVVGNVGLLHLGIAAFFGIGAYATGILTVPAYPFEVGFYLALVMGTLSAAAIGAIIGIPTLRLRGDYLALVTLGFGEVVKFTLRNLDSITAGTRGLNPVPPPVIPGVQLNWAGDYKPFYYLTLAFLCLTYVVLYRLEKSKLGRAWIAVREDELAAQCMGLNTGRLKLAAFVFAAAIAGMAGVLYATKMTSTSTPDVYDFNRSVFLLCCLILGGLGSRNGVVLGVVLLYGFDYILSPIFDDLIQTKYGAPEARAFPSKENPLITLPANMFTFSGWRLMLFGLVLIAVMRWKPEGLWPSNRVKEEVHPEPHAGSAAMATNTVGGAA